MPDEAERETLLPQGLSYRDWFRFVDRTARERDPASQDVVVTCRFSHESLGSPRDAQWEKEEWSIRAALLALDDERDASGVIAAVLRDVTLHNVEFQPSWRDTRTFDFGESVEFEGARLLAWIHTRQHPTNGQLLVEPRADFVRYHALENRGGTFFHLLDSVPVLETGIGTHGFQNPTPHVSVHRDYLRDYLAARQAALVISLVGDRFANLLPEVERDFENRNLELLADNMWLTTVVHPAQDSQRHRTMVRGALYWNVVVEPYPRPKPRRSPWPRFFPEADEDETVLRFIADAEGSLSRLGEAGCPAYLYFGPQVLEKYLTTPGYSVEFHMRNWGRAHGPRHDSGVDVGINSRGFVTAFAQDLERLHEQELFHWAHYSSLPVGEWCTELVQTRLMNNPPNAPSVVELLREARDATNVAYTDRFEQRLCRESELSERDRGRLSVGPVREDEQELFELVVPLYEWLVPSMDIPALRRPLDAAACVYIPRR